MKVSFRGRRQPCSDDPKSVVALGVRDDDQLLLFSVTQGQCTVLPDRMFRIRPGKSEPIAEYGCRLLKCQIMLRTILTVFVRIPLELHGFRVYLGRLTDPRFSGVARDAEW